MGDVRGAPDVQSASRHDLLDLMGRSAALFHKDARLTLLTNQHSTVPAPLFHTVECEIRPETLMFDRTVAQAGYVMRSDFKRPLAFLDTDMLFNDSLAEVLSEDFDVAVTWRDKVQNPVNGGLIIVNSARPERGRQFFARLVDVYRSAHGANSSWDGDQFALSDIFGSSAAEISRNPRREYDGVKVLFLPCEKYNYAPDNNRRSLRARLNGKTLIHFKGARKWMMPRYWDAYLAPLEQSAPQPPASFNLQSQDKHAWLDRAEKCAELLATFSEGRPGTVRLSDLGCGDQKLKRALAQRGLDVEYRGYDLMPQSAEVEAVDLERSLPQTPADIAVVLGVIEYLSDPGAFFKRLASHARAAIISHVTRSGAKYSKRDLKKLGWRNHLSAAEVEVLLAGAGWAVQARRKTEDGRTDLWLATRPDAKVASDFAVLSPYVIPPELTGPKVANLGDGFILQAIERLVGRIDPGKVVSPRVAPAPDVLERMRASRLVLIGGANQLNDNYRVWPGLSAAELHRSSFRFVPVGVGIHGDPARAAAMSGETKEILELVHERIEFSSWRCPITLNYLQQNLPKLKDRFLLTGCPVMFDRPLLDGTSFPDAGRVVVATVTERGDFLKREKATLEFVGRKYPQSEKILVLHQNVAASRGLFDPVRRLRRFAQKLGFTVIAPQSIAEGSALYDRADLHFGSRLHAHLTMLSRNKKSFVVPVDDRARGMADLFAFPLCDPARFEDYLGFDFERVRQAAQRTFPTLEKFVRSLR